MSRTESQTRRQQLVHGLGIAALGCVVVAGLSLSGVFNGFDLKLLDLRFRLRGERAGSDAIAIVAVDDATIRSYGRWPLPRDSYALLTASLAEAGARAIAFDLQFPADRNQEPEWDRLLAYVSGSHRNVVQAIWFEAPGTAEQDAAPDSTKLMSLRASGIPAAGATAAVPVAASAAVPFPDLLAAANRLGHITVAVDHDGAIRSVPMLIRYGERVHPSLCLVAYAAFRGWDSLPALDWSRRSAQVRWPDGARTRLPLQADGATGIDFAGDRAAFPRTYSMLELLQWQGRGEIGRLREAVGGRVVLVGLNSRHEAADDIGTTPFAAATPLVYVHANALDNLIRGRFLQRPPGWLHALALAGASVLLGWLFVSLPIPRAALAMGVAVAGLAALNQLLLAGLAVDLPPSAGLALAPLIYAGIASHRYVFLERRAREREADIREGRSVQQRFLPEALIGQRLSHYVIVEKLGAGGMGEVWRARDERLPRDVAVKLLQGRGLADDMMRRRFHREAMAFSKLNHPHIATIFEFDSQDGTDFIVMEFVRGTSLAETLKRGALPEGQALALGAQIAGALVEAHGHGVLHRDLKPANIMLTPAGEAKVLDFGVAKLLDPHRQGDREGSTQSMGLTETGGMVGTIAYMAPEVVSGAPADARTDVYGLGMLLYEMTTGSRPFRDDVPHELMYMILNQPAPDPQVLNARMSTRTRRIILRAIEKAPEDRFASAVEMLDELRAAAATSTETSRAVWVGREG